MTAVLVLFVVRTKERGHAIESARPRDQVGPEPRPVLIVHSTRENRGNAKEDARHGHDQVRLGAATNRRCLSIKQNHYCTGRALSYYWKSNPTLIPSYYPQIYECISKQRGQQLDLCYAYEAALLSARNVVLTLTMIVMYRYLV